MLSTIARIFFGFIGAALTTYVIGVVLNAQFVIGAHGVPVSIGDRLSMTAFDISNMTLYLIIIAIALALGFVVAAILKRVLPSLASIAYPLAGAAAIATTLGLMYMMFQTVPISGARGLFGFAAQVLAGGLGGWVFGKILNRNQRAITA